MKIEVTDVSPVKKNMAIEAGPDVVRAERQAVLKRYAKEARVPGFRRGKVPLSVIEKRFAHEVAEDIKERLIARLYTEAVKEKGLSPLGDPALEEIIFEEDEPFRFKTSFEVIPDFKVDKYRGVEVKKPAVAVGDAEVEQALEELQQAHTKLVSEEGRKAGTGDVIVVDMEAAPEDGEEFRREGVMVEIGGTNNLPEFNDALEGATAGATLEFPVDYPEEYEHKPFAGKTVSYKIQVHEVKRREVPELDDEFAKDLGEFETLDALKERIREDLLHRRRHEAEHKTRDALIDKVLLENPIPLPEILVELEVNRRMEETVRMMFSQGMDPRTMEIDWKKIRDGHYDAARKSVHARLVLDAVAEQEELEVKSEEVQERIHMEAKRIGESPEKFKRTLSKEGGLEAVTNQLLREKSLDFLLSVANIQGEE